MKRNFILLSTAVFLFVSTAAMAIDEDKFLSLCQEGSVKEIIEAIKSGVNVNAVDKYGYTALMLSVHNPDPAVAEVLIKSGADVKKGGKYNHTPISVAAYRPDITKLLISAGADVNVKDDFGLTPLIYAAREEECLPLAIEVLIKAGAKLNTQSEEGETALICAVKYEGNPEVIALLLSKGANAKLKDKLGKTALQYAKENKNLNGTEVYKLLEKASK